MYTVYQHINKENGKVYIGITKQDPEKRWGTNGSNYSSSPHFYSAIQKYGWDNFEHLILFENQTKENACEKEKELIKQFDATNRDRGYNQTTGGEVFELNDDAKMKKSASMMGNKNGLGHPCSDEKKRKIADAQRGVPFTEDHKQKLSESAKRRHTPCSDKKKETLSKSYPHKCKVYCQELDKVYDSVQSCGKELGIPPTNISKICKGKLKSSKGYHFRYYNDDTINA